MFSTPESAARTDRHAWVQAMLDFEGALALAQADAGLVPNQAATEIAEQCDAELFDVDSIVERAVRSATPVIPLVEDLTEKLGDSARGYVHFGATSQDVVDTAAMLLVERALEPVFADLSAVAEHCARLAEDHRETLMTGRSLLQQALPTTFGRKCAGWLVAVTDAAGGLSRLVSERLAVQFGGPVGTLASLGDNGVRVGSLLAERLGLAEPVLPWHTDRTRIAELAGALGTVSGALGKIALDVQLAAQTEVAELAEARSGGSSAMPHKRNPVRAVLISASTRRVPGLVSTLLSAMPQEHERAAGAWQAEWEPLVETLRLVASGASAAREMLGDLRVNPDRMRDNLELTGGVLMAERASSALTGELGPRRARSLVGELSRKAVREETGLRTELLGDATVRRVLSEQEIVEATEPGDYLGSAGAFVDRALDHHAKWKETRTRAGRS